MHTKNWLKTVFTTHNNQFIRKIQIYFLINFKKHFTLQAYSSSKLWGKQMLKTILKLFFGKQVFVDVLVYPATWAKSIGGKNQFSFHHLEINILILHYVYAYDIYSSCDILVSTFNSLLNSKLPVSVKHLIALMTFQCFQILLMPRIFPFWDFVVGIFARKAMLNMCWILSILNWLYLCNKQKIKNR